MQKTLDGNAYFYILDEILKSDLFVIIMFYPFLYHDQHVLCFCTDTGTKAIIVGSKCAQNELVNIDR